MTGRKSKLSKVQKDLIAALKTGATDIDACAHVGIAKQTLYGWLKRGEDGDPEFLDFLDSVTRARIDAKATAMHALKVAMQPYTETTRTVETFTETRLTRGGMLYDYVKRTEREQTTRYQGDWRAAIEYLKRRFPEEWGDRQRIDDWRSQAIEDIRAGKLPYEVLREAFDDSLAAELFRGAGVPIPAGTGAEEE